MESELLRTPYSDVKMRIRQQRITCTLTRSTSLVQPRVKFASALTNHSQTTSSVFRDNF